MASVIAPVPTAGRKFCGAGNRAPQSEEPSSACGIVDTSKLQAVISVELTLESAFSTGGLVGHLSYLLLVISMTMRIMWLLRVLVIASSFVAIGYDVFWLRDPVGVFWESLLVLVNIVQLCITYIENARSTFTEEEGDFVHTNFPGLSKKHKRRLLNLGKWIEGDKDLSLTTDGEPVSHLCYLASGEVQIASNGKTIGVCEPGSFIGEMTALTGTPANGTATITQPARFWSVAVSDLRKLASRHEEIEQALQACFQRNLMRKLINSNKVIERSGGMQGLTSA